MMDASDFVPVVFARNVAEAEVYKTLLEDHDITVQIEDQEASYIDLSPGDEGVPVLVPPEQLDEAELVIEQRSELDDDFDEDLDGYEDEDDEFSDFEEIDPDTHLSLDDSDEEEML